MTMELQIALLSAISALVGTAVGGLISYFTTRFATTQQHKHETRVAEISKKEAMFSEFLGEANRLAIQSATKDKNKDEEHIFNQIELLYSLQSRIEISGATKIAEASVAVRSCVLELFISMGAKGDDHGKAMIEFNKACVRFVDNARVELSSLRKSA